MRSHGTSAPLHRHGSRACYHCVLQTRAVELKDEMRPTGPHGQSSLPSSRWRTAQSPHSRTSEAVATLVRGTAGTTTSAFGWSALPCARTSHPLSSCIFRACRVGWGEGASGTHPHFTEVNGRRLRGGVLCLGHQRSHGTGQVRGKARTQMQAGLPSRGSSLAPSLPITRKARSQLVGTTDTELQVVRPGRVLTATTAPPTGAARHTAEAQ